MMDVRRLTAAEIRAHAPALIAMLREAVDEGAGLGFVPPVPDADAAAWVESAARDVERGSRVVLGALVGGRLVGSAQLDLCLRPNGLHRAECQKVIVSRAHRRAGVGRALLRAVDDAAREEGRTLLYLDTFADQHARRLYEAAGWTHAGDIPAFALTLGGKLGATSFYYKRL